MTASPPSDPWAEGRALLRAGHARQAQALYRSLLPHPEASLGIARSFHIQSMYAEALPYYHAAIAALPDPTPAQLDAATALFLLDRPQDLLEILRFLQPIPPVLRLRAAALARLDRLPESLAVSTQWLAADPANPLAHMEKATTLLALGRFAEAWPHFEHRWQLLDNAKDWHTRPQKLWRGETNPAGRTILVHAEQGLGDTLQFVRYVPLLRAKGARVILQVQPELHRLLQGIADHVITADPPAHDLHIPLMSLPFAFATTPETIPAPIPYLHADPTRFRARLNALPCRKIGLVWTGSAPPGAAAQNRRRSVPAEALAALAQPGITLISLQKNHPAPTPMIDWTDELHDFADTAALVAGLDLVISVDTSVAHLAGAMGKPVWLLNRFDSCWRWLRGRDDSPWYPTLRQFRQPAPGDWGSPLAAIAASLRA